MIDWDGYDLSQEPQEEEWEARLAAITFEYEGPSAADGVDLTWLDDLVERRAIALAGV